SAATSGGSSLPAFGLEAESSSAPRASGNAGRRHELCILGGVVAARRACFNLADRLSDAAAAPHSCFAPGERGAAHHALFGRRKSQGSEALTGRGERLASGVDADAAPAQLASDGQRRSAARVWVEDQVPHLAAGKEQAFQQGLGLLRG